MCRASSRQNDFFFILNILLWIDWYKLTGPMGSARRDTERAWYVRCHRGRKLRKLLPCLTPVWMQCVQDDCALLPVAHSTAEEMAHYIFSRLVRDFSLDYLHARGATDMEIIVSEMPRQEVRVTRATCQRVKVGCSSKLWHRLTARGELLRMARGCNRYRTPYQFS